MVDLESMKAATIKKSVGPTILLGSGNYYDYDDPEGSTITIEDFAYGLAFQSRFTGQCVSRRTGKRVFYSTAQHCVIGSETVPPEHAYDALMHEAGEPVCMDMNAPLKSKCPEYKTIEKRCEAANMKKFLVPMRDPALIKLMDIRLWATERRDLMRWNGERWSNDDRVQPYDFEIVPVGPYEAAEMFLDRFRQIAPKEVLTNGEV